MKEEWAAARVAAWEEISNGFREIEQPLSRTMVRYCRTTGRCNMPATAIAAAIAIAIAARSRL